MTAHTPTVGADQALKSKHRAMWALGDYPRLAQAMIPDLGAVLVEACAVGPADRVLDVAAGSGNAAIPAALTGASVVASDLTPELLESGLLSARERGATLEWREADAESLPFGDAEFDVVTSCLGVMFAPHHQAAADELVRAPRRGPAATAVGRRAARARPARRPGRRGAGAPPTAASPTSRTGSPRWTGSWPTWQRATTQERARW